VVSKELNEWLQVVGLFGVLAGLIFVGLQLRLDRQVAQANAVDAASDWNRDWAELVTENTDVWRKGLSGEPLSENEAIQFDVLARAWEIRQFSNWNRTMQTIEPSPAQRWARQAALDIHTNPGLRAYWHSHSQRMKSLGVFSEWNSQVDAEIERLDKAASE